MNIKQIKRLAVLSYTKNQLDIKTVNKIINQLDRKGLKTYIKAVKNIEKAKTVIIFTPSNNNKQNIENLVNKIFPDKKVLIKQDESLIAGVKVINNDDVYDFNLRNTLENLVQYISH
jgi:F0F1-type ATP synthase delta subunit